MVSLTREWQKWYNQNRDLIENHGLTSSYVEYIEARRNAEDRLTGIYKEKRKELNSNQYFISSLLNSFVSECKKRQDENRRKK